MGSRDTSRAVPRVVNADSGKLLKLPKFTNQSGLVPVIIRHADQSATLGQVTCPALFIAGFTARSRHFCPTGTPCLSYPNTKSCHARLIEQRKVSSTAHGLSLTCSVRPKRSRKDRPCDHCRRLKHTCNITVRGSRCANCVKGNRDCTFTGPSVARHVPRTEPLLPWPDELPVAESPPAASSAGLLDAVLEIDGESDTADLEVSI